MEAVDLIKTLPPGNLTIPTYTADKSRKKSEERAKRVRRTIEETEWEEV